jgi:hypothetical protein
MFITLPLFFFSCKKDKPSVDDNFLNYPIPDVPATADYTVGAFYYTNTVFNANIKEVPKLGKYTSSATGVVPANIIQAHIDYAAQAKINYFIFSLRSANLDANNYKIDSTSISSFLTASNASKVNFAISYNLSTNLLGITNAGGTGGNGVTIENNPAKLESFYKDFQRMAYFLKQANYQKVNGKYLLIINHAQDLNSNSNPALYTEIRKRLSALGFDLYIVGEQDQWSAPQAYFYRFQNCVDAMYEANMIDNRNVPDRYWLFPQFCDQNWAYFKKMIESWNVEFVPCVEPAYNYQIQAPTNTSLSTARTPDGAFYKTFTNVAKRNASKSRLIFVDSFNNFQNDTQVEPAESYGTLYLDMTRQAFKIN